MRRRVLDASIEAFAEGGFHGTGTRGIAERAGVKQGTIYHYFATKELLYVAAYEYSLEVAWATFGKSIAGCGSALEEIAALLQSACLIMEERPAMTLLAIRAETDLEESGHRILPCVKVVIDGIVDRAVDRGEIGPRDGNALARLVSMLLWGLSVAGRHERDPALCLAALEGFLSGALLGRRGVAESLGPAR